MVAFLTALADGHGGIANIEKIGTEGLEDTYEITLADDGRFVYTVTNGAKGDKGDNAYTWIKYASQEPTASAHSMGDLPDRWMGVYAGNSATAPTDWQQYKWFEIKGQKGDTGDPATVAENSVEYQVGVSGTEIPTGQWSTSIPETPQGSYLWSRTVTRFNTGDPITVYSVSRVGRDGLGTLRTINGIAADENGNVTLSATSVGALSKTGDALEGMLDAAGNRITGIPLPSEDEDAVPYRLFKNAEVMIWQNAATQSEFAGQTISLTNGNGGTRFVIDFAIATTDDRIVETAEMVIPTSGAIVKHCASAPVRTQGSNTYFAVRNFSVYGYKNQIRITFDSAYVGAEQDNTKLIPMSVTTVRRVI